MGMILIIISIIVSIIMGIMISIIIIVMNVKTLLINISTISLIHTSSPNGIENINMILTTALPLYRIIIMLSWISLMLLVWMRLMVLMLMMSVLTFMTMMMILIMILMMILTMILMMILMMMLMTIGAGTCPGTKKHTGILGYCPM